MLVHASAILLDELSFLWIKDAFLCLLTILVGLSESWEEEATSLGRSWSGIALREMYSKNVLDFIQSTENLRLK